MRLGIKIPIPARPADLAYSDDYSSNGLYNGTFPPQPEYALTGVTQGQTYQPHWCAAFLSPSTLNRQYNGTLPPQPEYAVTGVTQGQTYQPHWCAASWRSNPHALRV